MKLNDRAFAVLATDIAVLSVDGKELKVLLTTAKSINFKGVPTLPGGLVGLTEKTNEAAKRILAEVVKSTDFYMEQLYTFDDPSRDPAGRVVSVVYLMLVPWVEAKQVIKNDANWYPVKSLPKLAYDHNEVVKAAAERLIGKLTYTNIVYGLMPEEFTLSELQNVYETVLDHTIDKRNFRKKILSLGLLTTLSRKRSGTANRPAQLYTFATKGLREIEIL